MSARPALRVINGDGEVVESPCIEDENRALRAALTRAQKTIDQLRADKAAERERYVRRQVIEDAFYDWRDKTRHPRSQLTDDRFDAMKAMLEAGYTFEHFQLVSSALAAFPYERYGKRYASGDRQDLKDDIGSACEKARRFELLANLGHGLRAKAQPS